LKTKRGSLSEWEEGRKKRRTVRITLTLKNSRLQLGLNTRHCEALSTANLFKIVVDQHFDFALDRESILMYRKSTRSHVSCAATAEVVMTDGL